MSEQAPLTAQGKDAAASAGKRPYVAPSVRRVELRPDEAVLGACKAATAGGGPRASRCRSVSTCSTIGS